MSDPDSHLSPARRREREPGGRPHEFRVKLSDVELEKIASRAAAIRLTIPSYLATAALHDLTPASQSGGLSEVQRRAFVAELYAIKRILRGVGTNLNQLALVANSTGEVSPAALHEAALALRTVPRLDAFLDSARHVVLW